MGPSTPTKNFLYIGAGVGAVGSGFWRAAFGFFLTFLVAPGFVRAAEPPLTLERGIALPGVSGRIDHLAMDVRRGRLFVAALGNDSVEVIDLAAGTVLHHLSGLKEPQGIGYDPRNDMLAVASAGDGTVRLFRGDDFSPAGVVALGEDADDVRLDAKSGRFIIGYGSGGLALLDPPSRSVLRKVALPAHPEGFEFDPDSGSTFVNLPDAGMISVVDLAGRAPPANWPVPHGLRANFPMAIDAENHLLAVVFRRPARLLLLDMKDGSIKANVAACNDADDVFVDATRHRLYLSCGEGVVEVIQQDGGQYRETARVPTRSGARTALYVPQMDRLFVAAPAGLLGSDATVLVLKPKE